MQNIFNVILKLEWILQPDQVLDEREGGGPTTPFYLGSKWLLITFGSLFHHYGNRDDDDDPMNKFADSLTDSLSPI